MAALWRKSPLLFCIIGTAAALAQSCSIEGDVKDSNGRPLAGADIAIVRQDIRGTYRVRADSRGHYLYTGLPLGIFTVEVRQGGLTLASKPDIRPRMMVQNVVSFDLSSAAPPPAAPKPLIEPSETTATRSLVMEHAQSNPLAAHQFALVIGNNQYLNLSPLKTAVNDARAVAAILHDQYGFEIQLLSNARRDQILSALNQYRHNLPADASLLIYYAGHGHYDKQVEKAYWLPVDAQANENTAWVSADDITTNVKGIPARHVLIVSDSCYSGTLSRAARIDTTLPTERDLAMRKLQERPSRLLLASGGNEPVADSGGDGQHSIFAGAFLRGLARMEPAQFTVEELFQEYIRETVAGRSDQLPECGPLRNSGHEGGSFVFTRHLVPAPR